MLWCCKIYNGLNANAKKKTLDILRINTIVWKGEKCKLFLYWQRGGEGDFWWWTSMFTKAMQNMAMKTVPCIGQFTPWYTVDNNEEAWKTNKQRSESRWFSFESLWSQTEWLSGKLIASGLITHFARLKVEQNLGATNGYAWADTVMIMMFHSVLGHNSSNKMMKPYSTVTFKLDMATDTFEVFTVYFWGEGHAFFIFSGQMVAERWFHGSVDLMNWKNIRNIIKSHKTHICFIRVYMEESSSYF